VLDLAALEESLKGQGARLAKSLRRGQEGWKIKAEWWEREGQIIMGRGRLLTRELPYFLSQRPRRA